MKITETRKAIIELIEPFMDKTLSEGCLISVWANELLTKFEDKNRGYHQEFKDIKKILGHYDITAVFSYITSMDGNYKSNEEYEDTINILNFYMEKIGEIPNKPLGLYSPDEEVELLKLLKKLK